jgi:hypothetical protein
MIVEDIQNVYRGFKLTTRISFTLYEQIKLVYGINQIRSIGPIENIIGPIENIIGPIENIIGPIIGPIGPIIGPNWCGPMALLGSCNNLMERGGSTRVNPRVS